MIPKGTVGSNPILSAIFLIRRHTQVGRRGAPAKGVGRELPAREFKSLCLRHRWAMKKILPKKPPILSGVSPFLRSEKNLRFCECENGAFSFVAGCELPENRIQATERMDQSSPCAFFIPTERRKTMRKQTNLAKFKQTALAMAHSPFIFCPSVYKMNTALHLCKRV